MIDNQFDNFVNGKLKDHAAPVPAGLWDKVADGQFDNFFGDKLRDREAPVASDLWERITDTQFDSFVSGKLIDHTAPVPAGLWEKIRPEEKDDRKGFVLFRNPGVGVLVALFLLVGTLGGYFYFTAQKANHNNTNGTGIQKPADTKTPQSIETPSQPGGQKPSAATAPVTNGDKDQPVKQPATEEANAAPSKPAGMDASHHLNTGAPNPAAVPAEKQSSSSGNILPPVSGSSSLLLSPSARNKKTGLSLVPADPKNDNALLTYKDAPQNGITHNGIFTKGNDRAEENSFEFIEPYHSNLLTGVTIPSPANRKNGNGQPGLADKELIAGNHTSQFRNIIICPSDRKNRNTDLFIEAYLSPDIALRSLSNISASQQYLLRKDSSSTMQVGYSAGLRLVKPITDNILLKAGVQYTQMNERFVYRTENEVKTTTVVTVRTIVRAPGDTVIVSDTSVVQQIGFKNNTVKNRYRSFDIPVTVGYQFGNEDLKFGINAGVIFNISSWYQGVILDSSLATVPLTKSNNMVYKSNIGLGLYGSVSIVKKLGEDLHFFVEPYFRYNLSNMTTSQSSYNQKFSLGGVSFGLRFNLNR
jgi:hypothetical protein